MSSKDQFAKFIARLKPRKTAGTMQQQVQMGTEFIDHKLFGLTLAAAIVLHIMALYLYNLMPKTEVIDIPVRALNIKLGDGEPFTQDEQKAEQPATDNNNNVESAINKMTRDADPSEQARSKAVMSSMDKLMAGKEDTASKAFEKAMSVPTTEANALMQESAKKLSNIAKQFVRTNAMQAPSAKGAGSVVGNSTAKEAEMMERYEQLISLWIEKFKQYPDEARSNGMQGETVVRIRIDRHGNIRYYILERSTGFQVLDKAAIDMVKRANPVPAVPNDYPPGDLIEFLIPVNFHLQ